MANFDQDSINRLIEKANAILDVNEKTAKVITQLSSQIIEIQKQVNDIVRKLSIKGLLN